jgi:hypothetical protein
LTAVAGGGLLKDGSAEYRKQRKEALAEMTILSMPRKRVNAPQSLHIAEKHELSWPV